MGKWLNSFCHWWHCGENRTIPDKSQPICNDKLAFSQWHLKSSRISEVIIQCSRRANIEWRPYDTTFSASLWAHFQHCNYSLTFFVKSHKIEHRSFGPLMQCAQRQLLNWDCHSMLMTSLRSFYTFIEIQEFIAWLQSAQCRVDAARFKVTKSQVFSRSDIPKYIHTQSQCRRYKYRRPERERVCVR